MAPKIGNWFRKRMRALNCLRPQICDVTPEEVPRKEDWIESAIDILKAEKGYSKMKIIDKGSFGTVFSVLDYKKEKYIALKIMKSKLVKQYEFEIWPKLKHPNILSVLEVISLDAMKVTVFAMPLLKECLQTTLRRKSFKSNGQALSNLKIWLKEILYGIEYLHRHQLCHLDLKLNNILISNLTETAVVCDFTFLNRTDKLLTSSDVGSPYIYRPPEACRSKGRHAVVQGTAVDAWGFGMLSLEALTYFVLARKLPDETKCYREVHPRLCRALQEKKFSKYMKQAFPKTKIEKKEKRLALSFVKALLIHNPKERMSPATALKHPFLGGAGTSKRVESEVPDDIFCTMKKEYRSDEMDLDSQTNIWEISSAHSLKSEFRSVTEVNYEKLNSNEGTERYFEGGFDDKTKVTLVLQTDWVKPNSNDTPNDENEKLSSEEGDASSIEDRFFSCESGDEEEYFTCSESSLA